MCIVLHCVFAIYVFSTDYIIFWGDLIDVNVAGEYINTYNATTIEEKVIFWLNF